MSAITVTPPFPVFSDITGAPLQSGFVYVGTAGLNAEANQIPVFWDNALTIPALQPLRTINGYISRNGSPAQVYADAVDYSLLAKSKSNALIWSSLKASGISPDAFGVAYLPAGTGTVETTVGKALDDVKTVKSYGAVGNGVADDTAAIQGMLTDLGYFTLPEGTFKITDSLVVPLSKNLGAIISGNGMEKSILNCVGMVGKPAITGAGAGAYRVSMRDFSIVGDADNCVRFNSVHAFYQSSFDNLVLRSGAGSCFKMDEHFSCSWTNVHVQSVGGHGFEIEGGNSTVLTNCYAHNFTVGNGKAGYRIRGNAVLVACNGIDSGDAWGIFGDDPAYGGTNSTFQIRMIGCNIEDFDKYAIGLVFTGNIQLIGNSFVPKATGTYETLIKGNVSTVFSNWRLFDRGNIFASKGSTRSGASNILSGAPTNLDVSSGIFTDYFNVGAAILYPLSNPTTSGPTFGVIATKFPNLDADRFFGFVAQAHGNWTPNATTFNVAGLNLVRTANTVATNLDGATGGSINGHRLTIMVNDSNTVIRHNIGGAGRFSNTSGANITAAIGKVYEYVFHNSVWWQVGG